MPILLLLPLSFTFLCLQRCKYYTVRGLELSSLLWYNGYDIKSTSERSLRLARGGVSECDLSPDHNLDHLQVWTTWELWTLRHEKARVSDEKARKSTQNEAKNRCRAVWELDAAGSSPVTSTKNRGFDRKIKAVRGILAAFYFIFKDQHYGKNNVF